MMRAGGSAQIQDAAADDGLTVVLGRAPFMVVWSPQGLQLHVAGVAAPIVMSAQDGRHLADLLTAAADFEEAA